MPGADPTQRSSNPVVMTEDGAAFHRRCLVIDGHNDLVWQIYKLGGGSLDRMNLAEPQTERHTDIVRLRRGGLGAQFWAAFVPCSAMREGGCVRIALEQIDIVHRMIARWPETFALARSPEDIEHIHRSGRIASLIGIEGGHAIESSLAVLRTFHALGARYMTLTHSDSTDWCDAATDAPKHNGLTSFGREVVAEMNRVGMIVDVAHTSIKAMHDVLDVSRAPIINSHSGALALAAHPRNIPDEVIRRIAVCGGLVMVNFYSGLLYPPAAEATAGMFEVDRELRAQNPDPDDYARAHDAYWTAHPVPRGTIHNLVDHIDHVVKVAGIDHVGLGSDFDGVGTTPEQVDDVACYPFITQALLDRGYVKSDIRRILGENLMGVFRRVVESADSSA
ncbi:MAG: dipeptidase [Phycisphaerae bacterium]|nr:dipeptidase [Phycisphaerae bacterium]